MKSYTFRIERLTPSLNVYIRLHYRRRLALHKTWFQEAVRARGALGIPSVRLHERRRVSVISSRTRPLDPDNFTGGLKPLLDGLVNAELLYDDAGAFLELEARQLKVKHRADEGTAVKIEPSRSGKK